MTPATTSETTDLRVSVESPSAWNRKLTITVPAPRVQSARARVIEGFVQKARRPGFRRGRVPKTLIEKELGRDIERETLQRVLEESFREAVAREGLEPISEGAIEIVRYAADSDLVFEVAFDIRPEIRLARLGGFKIKRPPVEPVTDQEIEEALRALQEARVIWNPVDRAAGPGEKVAVVVTVLQGVAEPGPRRYEFPLAEGHAIPDVESAIQSLSPGNEGEFIVRYPADFPDEPKRGTSQRLRIRLEGVWSKELPALSDEFARDAAGVAGLEELRGQIAADLRRRREDEARRRLQSDILDRVLEANPFEVPESMVRRYLDTLLVPAGDADPEALERARARYRPAAVWGIKRTLVVQRVADDAALNATPEEVSARVEALAARAGTPVAEARRHLEQSGGLREIARRITEEKVFEHVASLSTIE